MVKNYKLFLEQKNFNSKLDDTINNPNFSIVVPGGCNAKCEFCFYKQSKVCESYIEKLVETMNDLPNQFYQLSLTGGEPTLSPYLELIINSIDIDKWTHTVLTTNGTKLEKFIPILKEKIKFINISRHHYDDKINESIFKTDSIPNSEKLKDLVNKLQSEGISVTYSAVITEHLDSKEEIEKYIEFAKSHNVKDVFFRKKHGTLDPSNAEKSFESIESETHSCPVCRNTRQVINESNITWKASLEEPSKELGMIYETVFNEDGSLSKDWNKEFKIDPLLIKENFYVEGEGIFESCGGSSDSSCGYSDNYSSYGYSSNSSGCGSFGCGTSANYYDEEDEEELKNKIKMKQRTKKINKLKKEIQKRKDKQKQKYKDSFKDNIIFKYDDFMGESIK